MNRVGVGELLERSEKVFTDPRASGKSSGDHKPLSEKHAPSHLHPLFEEILKPYYPGVTYSNGVREQGGVFYVPRLLASMYDGPAYRGRVILIDEKGEKE